MVRVRKNVVRHEGTDVKFKSPSKKDIKITKIFRGKLSHASSVTSNSRNTRSNYFSSPIYSHSSENLNPQLETQTRQSCASKPNLLRRNPISNEVPQDETYAPVCRTSLTKNIETDEKIVEIKRELVDVKTEPKANGTFRALKVEDSDEVSPKRLRGPENGVLEKEAPIVGHPSEEGVHPSGSSISPTPHKIQLCEGEIERPLTTQQFPASALSYIKSETSTPKKAVKGKRRLNPSQTANQQSKPLPPVKAQRSTKEKIAEVNHKLTEYYLPVRRSVRKTKQTVLEEQQMMVEAAIKSQCEDGLEVRNFEGKGRGVVATRDFCKGDFVIEYCGELISIAEAKAREQLYAKDQNTGCYMYYFKYNNNQYCIDSTKESARLGRLVNHSRYGNLVTKTVSIDNIPHLVLIAKDKIDVGEEILYDYGDRSKESLVNHPWLNL